MAEESLGGKVRRQALLQATKDMKLWIDMIVHVLKGHGT